MTMEPHVACTGYCLMANDVLFITRFWEVSVRSMAYSACQPVVASAIVQLLQFALCVHIH